MRYLTPFILLLTLSLNAQVLDPVKWSFDQKHIDGNEFELIFKASIDEGWTIYSQYLTSDDGPVRTSFFYDEGAFEKIGKTKEEGPKKEGYDKIFEMDVIKFYKKATFTQRVKVSDYSKPITGYLEFMTCDATRCLPPTEVDFSFTLQAPNAAVKQEQKVAETPKAEQKKITEEKAPSVVVEKEETTELVAEEAPEEAAAERNDGIIEPVKWEFSKKELEDGLYELTFTANLEDNWNIYSQFTEDDGPIPTGFYFTEGEHFQKEGETTEEGKKKEGMDPIFGVNVIKFPTGPVVFKQNVKVLDSSKPVEGYIEYMSCNDRSCIALEEEFSFTFGATVANNPALVPGIENQDGKFNQSREPILQTYTQPLGNCGKEDVARDTGLIWTFILGFAGGLLALLTPCVFPMIPLTVSFFTKSSKDRASGIKNAVIYGLSIIVIYVSIGLFITAAFGAEALNQLSTNWIANTLFFLIFVAFALSFFGYYEITLPSSWANKSDQMADRGGLIGTFFMAFTLALVSFSCTGPIIGSALVESASNSLGPFVVMLGFSTALALPFALFAAFPGWLNSLPKSGGWMNTVKVFLGFLELALALKFLSVADMTMHWGILPYEVFMGLWVLIFIGMALYMFGFIRFPHDTPGAKPSNAKRMVGLASLLFAAYLGTGFMIDSETKSYNALAVMSGLAPSTSYNLFLPEPPLDASIKERYPSFTKCANNLDCFKDYYEGVAYAKEVNKPVLLDFTGYGCVNCRKTEEHIWDKISVKSKINDEFVLVSLYVDDRKPLEEVLVSAATNKKIRNVGNKWADFQIVNFQQNTQPLYVMMSPDEQVLAAPRGYKTGVQDYADFLSCGLSTFNRMAKQKPLGVK